jgi:hypothetical protein
MIAGNRKESGFHPAMELRRPSGCFLINATPGGLENIFTVELNLASWPSNPNHLSCACKSRAGIEPET